MSKNDDVDMLDKKWRLNLNEVTLSSLSLPSSIQSVLLLATLPPSWQPFISTNSSLTNISVPTLVASIGQENILHKASKHLSSSHVAMYMKHSKNNNKFYKKPTPRTNFKGHSKYSKSYYESYEPEYRFLKLFFRNC